MNATLFQGIRTTAMLLVSTYFLTPIPSRIVSAAPVLPVHNRPYHEIAKIGLAGTERWDYLTLDSAARRLYVTRGTRVVVLNVDTGKVVGQISPLSGVHGVALAPELNRGFTSNGGNATVSIFDLKTLKVIGAVKTGENPDAIVYEPVSQRVFAFNGKSNSTTVFDAKNSRVLGTIPLNGTPESAIADGLGHVYANIETTSEVVAITARNLTITARFPLAPGAEPTGIAIDRSQRRLFISCRNEKMAVVDADSGQVKTTLTIGKGADANAFDPATGMAFSSNGDGTLTIVREDTLVGSGAPVKNRFSVVDNVKTQRGARTMALDTKTHHLFLATAQFEPSLPSVPGQPAIRPKLVPNTFRLLIFGR